MSEHFFPKTPEGAYNEKYTARSTGPDWLERIEVARMETMDNTLDNFFGETALREWEQWKKVGEAEADLQILSGGNPDILEMIRPTRQKVLGRFAMLNEQMRYNIATDPKLVKRTLNHYLATDTGAAQATEFLPKKYVAIPKDSSDEVRKISITLLSEQLVNRYPQNNGKDLDWTKADTKQYGGLLLGFLRFQREQNRKSLTELEPQFAEFKKRVQGNLELAITNGTLPLSREIMIERIEHLRVRLIDNLAGCFQERGGDYDPQTHTMRIGYPSTPGKMWQTYVHEVMHALSGQTETAADAYEPSWHTRIGFHLTKFQDVRSEKQSVGSPALFWLNEAETEELAGEIGEFPASSYPEERALRKKLIEQGVLDPGLLRQAYFENYAQGSDTHPTPHLRALLAHANKNGGPSLLTNIDIYIRHHAHLNQKPDTQAKAQYAAGVRGAVNILSTVSISEATERFAIYAQRIREALDPSRVPKEAGDIWKDL